jgi:dipeptidyl aminopeptidase/acylaminoacyl peptidase
MNARNEVIQTEAQWRLPVKPMRKYFWLSMLLLACYCLAIPASGNSFVEDGAILERKTYVFPAYEKAKGIERLYSKEVYNKAINDNKFVLEKLTYSSQKLKVTAYLYKPKALQGKKFPAIIYNRGSYVRGDIGCELVPFIHRLATEGFIIIAPMYRESDGGEGRDEMGGDDVNDLMNILPLAKSLEFVDVENLFMYGESRGGMMTLQAIKYGFPVKAAATFGAFTDLDALMKPNPALYEPLKKTIWPDFDSRREEILDKRSAIKWADKINIPLLIMHGGNDQSVSPVQSLNFAQELQRLGKKYELLIYADDNHVLSSNQQDRDKRAIAWFKKYMK